MDHGIFSEISIIIALGSAIAFIMQLLKQPLIVGHAITGILAGPLVFDLVHAEDTVELFAMIGIALLLFIIGLGLNPKVIKELGRVSFVVAGAQMAITLFLGTVIGLLFGLGFQTALIVGVTISFSSTIIILKIISDKKEQTRLYGRLAIGLLLAQDIAATIALLIISAAGGDGFSISDTLWLIVKGVGLGLGLYLVNKHVITPLKNQISESQEFLFLFALGWGLGIPALFEQAGFSFEVGALFAGVVLATQPYAQEVGAKLRPLRDFFIVLFFVGLGVDLELNGLSENIGLIIVLSLTVLLLKPLIVTAGLGRQGYTKKTSFQAGSTMAQVSEFSIVFLTLAVANELLDSSIASALIFVSLITITFSTYIMKYGEEIFLKVEDKMHLLFTQDSEKQENDTQHNYQALIFGYNKGGSEFIKTFNRIKKKFVVIDYDPLVIDKLDHEKIEYLYGDATDPQLLEELGVDKVKIVVATFTDHQASLFLVKHIHEINPGAIIVLHADDPQEAEELYVAGATYVMLPHYIGSEKLSSFIVKHGLKKSEFTKWRDKHLTKLQDIV